VETVRQQGYRFSLDTLPDPAADVVEAAAIGRSSASELGSLI
jgi:hypothetical protein